MAKDKNASPNLFGDFTPPTSKAEESKPVKEEPVKDNKPEKGPAKPKKKAPTKKAEATVKALKKRGRPKAEYERDMKYVDMSGVDSYVTVRAKQEGMYVSEFLRYLVMKDGKAHSELFTLLVDDKDDRVTKDLEKFKISM